MNSLAICFIANCAQLLVSNGFTRKRVRQGSNRVLVPNMGSRTLPPNEAEERKECIVSCNWKIKMWHHFRHAVWHQIWLGPHLVLNLCMGSIPRQAPSTEQNPHVLVCTTFHLFILKESWPKCSLSHAYPWNRNPVTQIGQDLDFLQPPERKIKHSKLSLRTEKDGSIKQNRSAFICKGGGQG